jgi:hypothetical protein
LSAAGVARSPDSGARSVSRGNAGATPFAGAIRKPGCLIQIKGRCPSSLTLHLTIKQSSPTPPVAQDVVEALEGVRLARESVASLLRQLEADRPLNHTLVSRSRELLVQSEALLARASVRVMRSAPFPLYDHLAQAERHVKQGLAIIARQREIIVALERDGHDTADALRLLADFEGIQQMHVADRDRLRSELGIG